MAGAAAGGAFRLNQRRFIQADGGAVWRDLAFVRENRQGGFRDAQAQSKIAAGGERKILAATAVMVVLKRAMFLVRRTVIVVVNLVPATVVLKVSANRYPGAVSGEDTCVQSGEDAENQKPCQETSH